MQLLISCPNCNTSYQISDDQLQESDGQARCFHCQTVFNAALNSQPIADSPTSSSSPGSAAGSDVLEDSLNLDEHALEEALASQFSDQSGELAETDLSSLFTPEQDSQILNGPDDEQIADSSILLPEELLDIESDKAPPLEPLSSNESEKPARNYSNLGTALWMIGSIALVIIFIMQASWNYRHTLLLNPQARQVFETACKALPCKLPARRDPTLFEVVDRTVSIHPDVNDVLSINMLFTNNADFSQPAPGVTLTLFNSLQQVISRRSFTFDDYIKTEESKPPMLASGQAQKFFLNLEDPGPDVTGFEFSFY